MGRGTAFCELGWRHNICTRRDLVRFVEMHCGSRPPLKRRVSHKRSQSALFIPDYSAERPRRPTVGRSILCGVTGLIFGIILVFFSMFAAGSGEGVYFPLGLVSSPWGVFQNIPICLAGTVIFWSACGYLLPITARPGPRLIFLSLMGMHYLLLFWILREGSIFADWNYLRPDTLLAAEQCITLYIVGQIAVWFIFPISLLLGRRRS
jgi:hypothetical protein